MALNAWRACAYSLLKYAKFSSVIASLLSQCVQILDRPRDAGPDDIAELAERRHILRRVGGDHDQVGVLPLLDGADLLVEPHGARGNGGGGDDDLRRRHAR